MTTVGRTDKVTSAHRANGRRTALRFTAADGQSGLAWRAGDGWHVEASSQRLRERLSRALRKPVRVAKSRTEADGTRVLLDWEDVAPTDPRYPALWMLQLSHLGLSDVTVERSRVSPRSHGEP